MSNIGKTLRIMRELYGLRQGEFAIKLNVSSNYLSMVENEKREPSLRFLRRAAQELDLPLSVFFWDDMRNGEVSSNKEDDPAMEINRLFWDLIKVRLTGKLKSNG